MIFIRTFLAIDFNSALKSRIAGLQSQLRQYSSQGRWKHPDNFHLTLKFLDEIDGNKADEIDRTMKLLCKGQKPFELKFSKLGFFPDGRNAASQNIRVLWLGIAGDMERLAGLQSETETAMEGLGFARERRPFSPHITLAQDIILPNGFDEMSRNVDLTDYERVRVDKLYLFKSEQIKGKRIYTPISEYRF